MGGVWWQDLVWQRISLSIESQVQSVLSERSVMGQTQGVFEWEEFEE